MSGIPDFIKIVPGNTDISTGQILMVAFKILLERRQQTVVL